MPTRRERSFERARAILRAYPAAKAQLAVLDDKHLLFNSAGTAFIMYAGHGRSCVALGDPVGPPQHAPALIRQFHTMCTTRGLRPVFHELSNDHLATATTLGLHPLRIAEEARVRLDTFSLTGRRRHNLRNRLRNATKDGRTFTWVPSLAHAPHRLSELHAISHEWLGTKPSREKRFSLGRFDPDYLTTVDFAAGLIQQHDQPLAFVTTWAGTSHQELYLDLMRCRPTAPRGTMDLLFVRMLQQAHADGYTWFNLGMSPLPPATDDLSTRRFGRLYAQARDLAHHFYNLDGLRQYKDKFDPHWSPRYLLAPSRPGLLRALSDVALLTSGGTRGILGDTWHHLTRRR
ncbi:DUF2156 domain-containing protein [Pseudonocardia sp. C8]|nr:phosphatidylglycerol lysyltransferase domain-containing protein [Pseudonocardia sp. C8]MBC3193920.1 DUF2156 domain-containing protein [Pseudonocardia sp. C8]